MRTYIYDTYAYLRDGKYLPIFASTYLLKIVVSAYHWNLVGILFQMWSIAEPTVKVAGAPAKNDAAALAA